MFDVATTCRTCYKTNVKLVHLFGLKSEEYSNLTLAQILLECTTIQVKQEDGLPQNICEDCEKLLHQSYEFRSLAIQLNVHFKNIYRSQSTIKEELEVKTENQSNYLDHFDDSFDYGSTKSEPDEKSYNCDKCTDHYTDRERFLKHMESHQACLSCVHCNETVPTQAALDEHLKMHTYRCKECGEDFASGSLLLEHNTFVHLNVKMESEERFQCPECDMCFLKARSLAMHKKKHNSKPEKAFKFICDICQKVFSIKSLLKRHLKLHSDVKPFICPKCPKSYSRQDQMTDHINRHHDGHKPYACKICNKAFTQLCGLKDHHRTHTGETPFLCSECGKGFSNRSNLRQHMMRHSGLKPHACKLCPKTFCTKGTMKTHMLTHTGAHPYKCEKCGAAFTMANSLKKHALIHLAQRPYACDTCDKRFTCKDHLTRHTRKHTGEKPYRCTHCERAFTQSNDLVKHMRAHFGQNLYQCTVCQKKFRLMTELKLHYPEHFNDPAKTSTEVEASLQTEQELYMEKNAKIIPSVLEQNQVTEDDKLKEDLEGSFVITINSCNANGVVGDITINIEPGKS